MLVNGRGAEEENDGGKDASGRARSPLRERRVEQRNDPIFELRWPRSDVTSVDPLTAKSLSP